MTRPLAIGINGIGCYLPSARISNLDRLELFSTNESFVRNKTGFVELARKSATDEASDLAVAAIEQLRQRTPFDLKDVDCLVVVTQNPDVHGLPHTSAIVHGKLKLSERCAAFDISLGCSGWVHGLAIVSAFMSAQGLTKGLLVTADPYSRVIQPDAKDVGMLFGDGATATLLTDEPEWRLGRFDIGTNGSLNEALHVDHARVLHMNGRAVFTFAATQVPGSIQRALDVNQIAIGDVDRFILHQGSKYILDEIARRLGIAEKSPFSSAAYGNTVSSAVPMTFVDGVKDSDKLVVVCGFGVGLSWATTVLRRD